MKHILLFIVVSTVSVVRGQSCSNGRNCVTIYNCPEMLALINKPDRTAADTQTLQRSSCGFEGQSPKVCCREPCYTPDGDAGQCVGIYSCPHMAKLLQPPVTKEKSQFVQWSKCSGSEQYSVCCGPPKNNVDVQVGNCQNRLSAFPHNPRSECCGVDSNSNNRIIGGVSTSIEQYPWLVIIEYLKDNQIKLLCGGALISNKYALTAAHCVTGAIFEYGTPKNVRLGEYDTSNDGPDCVFVSGGGEDCTEPALVVPIERTIPHPDYGARKNDIALIRMAKMVDFTDFIRPICLPSTDRVSSPPPNFRMYAAGWGALNETVKKSAVKQHVDLPYVSRQQCQPSYNVAARRTTLWEKQLCAGGEKNKDSCKGDSGGPLMYENVKDRSYFEIIGLVSFGPTPCGIENIPGVYTNVYEYDTWIRTTIRP